MDVGSGLGGLVFYLAACSDTQVTGLELNPWMVQEATRRIPAVLRNRVNFVDYVPPTVPFSDRAFDIVISKGVLVHVEDKVPLFCEFHRVLKPGGTLLINDWLSPRANHWGKKVQAMCDAEHLTLYAQTPAQYQDFLKQAGFSVLSAKSEDADYIRYNGAIAAYINNPKNHVELFQHFPEADWRKAIESYQGIADSIAEGELLIRRLLAQA